MIGSGYMEAAGTHAPSLLSFCVGLLNSIHEAGNTVWKSPIKITRAASVAEDRTNNVREHATEISINARINVQYVQHLEHHAAHSNSFF